MNEVDKLKARYSQSIEDGKKIRAFTDTPEWNWYKEHVIEPTVKDYTNRILTGKILSDKEDWIMRGMIMGIKMVIETPDQFERVADEAKKKAKLLQESLENE